jgi:hypothetical protein
LIPAGVPLKEPLARSSVFQWSCDGTPGSHSAGCREVFEAVDAAELPEVCFPRATQARVAVSWSLSASGRTVRVSVVPHCAQPWVMSSRLPDCAPPLDRAGVIAVIVMRCPQQGQGSRKLGRFDRIRLLKDTESLSHAPDPTRHFPDRSEQESRKICATHINVRRIAA